MTAQEEFAFVELDIFLGRLTPMQVYEKMKESASRKIEECEAEIFDLKVTLEEKEAIVDELETLVDDLKEDIEVLKKKTKK